MGGQLLTLLDTHALIWFAEDHRRLGVEATRLTDRALRRDDAAIAAISFWEIAALVGKARIALDRSPAAFRLHALGLGVREIPIGGAVAVSAGLLDGLHNDLADRLIVATALDNEATLITADRRLLGWEGPLKTHDARR